jgi:hypothetical protein
MCDQAFRPRLDNINRGVGTGEYCSRRCAGEARRDSPPSSPLVISDCAICSAAFVSRHGATLCGPSCKAERHRREAKDAYHSAKATQGDGRTPIRFRLAADRRARRLTAGYVEDVTIQALAYRDGKRCHLCGRRVHLEIQWPDPRSGSIDHIVPISDGGEHSYRNTALAHLNCNLTKHTNAVGEQLRLIG